MRLIDVDALPYEKQVLSTDEEWCLKVVDIEAMPTIEQPTWISCAERLPEPFVTVVAHVPLEAPCPTVRAGFLTHDGKWHIGLYDYEAHEVTHWMPMPNPPGENSENCRQGECFVYPCQQPPKEETHGYT